MDLLRLWVCLLLLVFPVSADPQVVYMVVLREVPLVHKFDVGLDVSAASYKKKHNTRPHSRLHHHQHRHIKGGDFDKLQKPRPSQNVTRYSYTSYLIRYQNSLLKKTFQNETYKKLYSYHYLVNGFSVLITPLQAVKLAARPEVSTVVKDFSVHAATTHTPEFLGLPKGAWTQEGGPENAGEGIVIGFIDTGIDPTHPSFSDKTDKPYPIPPHFTGACEVTRDFPSGSCNRKLVGARHFAASAIARGIFNSSQDYASPYDGDGHGTHTASIAAGNHGVPVVVSGHHFGNASGMAPRAQYLLPSYPYPSISANLCKCLVV